MASMDTEMRVAIMPFLRWRALAVQAAICLVASFAGATAACWLCR
jgi:hypothetical protein